MKARPAGDLRGHGVAHSLTRYILPGFTVLRLVEDKEVQEWARAGCHASCMQFLQLEDSQMVLECLVSFRTCLLSASLEVFSNLAAVCVLDH